jgi:hypothetical protein
MKPALVVSSRAEGPISCPPLSGMSSAARASAKISSTAWTPSWQWSDIRPSLSASVSANTVSRRPRVSRTPFISSGTRPPPASPSVASCISRSTHRPIWPIKVSWRRPTQNAASPRALTGRTLPHGKTSVCRARALARRPQGRRQDGPRWALRRPHSSCRRPLELDSVLLLCPFPCHQILPNVHSPVSDCSKCDGD